jgi:hypothetical protein
MSSVRGMLRDQITICDIHLEAMRTWLTGELVAKGFAPAHVDIERDRDGWKIWLRVKEGAPFPDYHGGASEWFHARGPGLVDAFDKAAAAVEGVVARNAYDAWFALDQDQAATAADPDTGTAAVIPLQARCAAAAETTGSPS